MALELFDYQAEGVGEVRQAYVDGARAVLFVLPTGGGKTICFSYMAMRAAGRGLRVLLLAHRRELVGQISAALARWDLPHGIIAPAAKPTQEPVQVAMAQTLARRVPLDRAGRFRFDLVIVDEAHHATPDSTWGAIIQHNDGARLLGVSATPCRLDGKGLGVAGGGFFDALVIGPSVQTLIDRGRLARPWVFSPESLPDLGGVKKRGGDFEREALAAAMDKPSLTGNAVDHYREHCPGAPAIAFTVTTKHSTHVVEQFQAAGFSAAVLTGSTPDRERGQMIRDLGTGRLNVLASCNVVSEGTDIPNVVAAILLRATASFALAKQQMGRPMRIANDKTDCFILDHAGNALRHGPPEEPVEWSLNGEVKRRESKLKPCYACKVLVPQMARACPRCGHSMTGAQPAALGFQEDLALPVADGGKLVELTPERRREYRAQAEQAARTLDDYKAIGETLGYKAKWAELRYQSKLNTEHFKNRMAEKRNGRL